MGTSFVLSSLAAVLLGTIASCRAGSFIDNLVVASALVGYSTPPFWMGLIAIITLALGLGWFPTGGMVDVRSTTSGLARWLDIAHHLAMPALALGFFQLALVTRLTRGSMLEVLRLDFITFARAKGISEKRVIYRHAFPNALLPVITVIGLRFGFVLAGAVLTETVFAWPGLGRLTVEAVSRRDFPILLGMLIITSVLVVLANLATDLVYVLINPRIRIGDRAPR
jgi:peptide/nickel transport system permease protein